MTSHPRRTRRYHIRAEAEDYAILTLRGGTEYHYRRIGQYVWDVTDRPGTSGDQVCEGLGYRGVTLMPPVSVPLARIICAEARRPGAIDALESLADVASL